MTQDEIYGILEKNGGMSIKEILGLGYPRSTVHYCLNRMLNKGIVERKTVATEHGVYYLWRIKNI